MKKVTDIVAEIAAASHEQSAGIDQVNHAVMQMDEMTQQNAALVEEAAAAARAMQEQAGELTQQVGFFQLSDDGRAPASRRRIARSKDRSSRSRSRVRRRAQHARRRRHAPRRARAWPRPPTPGAWKEF